MDGFITRSQRQQGFCCFLFFLAIVAESAMHSTQRAALLLPSFCTAFVLLVILFSPQIYNSTLCQIYYQQFKVLLQKTTALAYEYGLQNTTALAYGYGLQNTTALVYSYTELPKGEFPATELLSRVFSLYKQYLHDSFILLYREVTQNPRLYAIQVFLIYSLLTLMTAAVHSLNRWQWILLKGQLPVHDVTHRFVHSLLQQTVMSPADALCQHCTGQHLSDYVTGHTLAKVDSTS